MCPKKEEQFDDNVSVNKQRNKCDTSNLTTSDKHQVEFRRQYRNKDEIKSNRIKLWLFIHILFSILFVLISCVVVYKLYTQVVEMQNKMVILNERIESLRNMYENKFVDDRNMFEQPVAGKMKKELVFADADENKDGNYEFVLTNSNNRLRRAHRGSQPKKTRRKIKSSGTLAAHFKGSLPEIHIKDQGLIGPWYPDNMVSRQYKFSKFHLTEGKCSIEVTEPALYFIYAQVYYITSNTVNSYTVYVRSEGSSDNNIIAKCSAAAVGPNNSHISEISCYTATIYTLKVNDRIFIQQTEKNRTIILRDGHSFFGLVRLNSSRNK